MIEPDDYELPQGWTLATVASALEDVQTGFASGVHNSSGEGVPHLRPMNVSILGKIDRTSVKSVDPSLADRPERRLRRGDVLFNNTNSPELVGKTALFDDDDAPAFSNHMTRLRTRPSVASPAFLARYLHSRWASGDFAQIANNHVSQASVGRKALANLLLPLPDLYEQGLIVERLDAVDSYRKAAVTHLSRTRLAINEFQDSILARACSGELTAAWREANPPDEDVADLIARSTAAVQAGNRTIRRTRDIEPAISEIPETWAWAQMSSMAQIRGGIQKKPDRAPVKNHFPYLRVANVLRSSLDLQQIERFELREGELAKYRLEAGDLLIVEGNGSIGEIGRSAIWTGEIDDCVHQNHLIRVRPAFAVPEYLNMFWNSPAGAAEVASLAVTTAGLYNLSVGKIATFPVPVPPIHEQREIVRIVTELLHGSDDVLAEVNATEVLLNRAGHAALASAFRGELIAKATR